MRRRKSRKGLLEQGLGWAYQAVVEGSLPWGEGREYSFREFSEKYTLHDSVWVGLFYDVAYEDSVVLTFVWDAVWLPDEMAQSTSTVADWPLLFIKVERASQVSTSGYKEIGGVQRGVGGAEVEKIGGVSLLVITDHYGGSVEVSFKGGLTFLALDRGGRVIPIG